MHCEDGVSGARQPTIRPTAAVIFSTLGCGRLSQCGGWIDVAVAVLPWVVRTFSQFYGIMHGLQDWCYFGQFKTNIVLGARCLFSHNKTQFGLLWHSAWASVLMRQFLPRRLRDHGVLMLRLVLIKMTWIYIKRWRHMRWVCIFFNVRYCVALNKLVDYH